MNVFRADKSTLAGAARRTPEGYIEDRPIVTRTGVFPYMNADGTLRLELRHPDDVMDAASLASLSMLPVTLDHPDAPVTADNSKALAVGFTGEAPSIDRSNVHTAVRVTDAAAVAAIEGGKRELSLGYRVDLIEEAGTYNGSRYTHRQTNIRYNHLALVDRARMGAQARIRIDGAEQVDENATGDEPPRKDRADMKKITLDGIEYDAAPEVINALAKANADGADLRTQIAAANARADKAEGERDAAQAQVKQLEARNDSAAIAAGVKERLALVKAAEAANLDKAVMEKLDGLSDREIREAIIRADDADVNLDGKSDDYVAARFDAAVVAIGRRAQASGQQRQAATPRTDGQPVAGADAARARMDAQLDYRNRGKEGDK